MKQMIYGLLVVVVALAVVVGLQFRAIDTSRESARADSRALWRSVICTIEQSETVDPRTSIAKRTLIIKFWTNLLVEQVHTAPCQ